MGRAPGVLYALGLCASTPLEDSVVAADAAAMDASFDLPGEAADVAAPEDIRGDAVTDMEVALARCDDGGCPPDPVVRITAGNRQGCALRASGRMTCWGANDYGTLGAFTASTRPPPQEFRAFTDARSVSAGFSQMCAVRRAGELWCWGRNAYGAVGVGSYSEREEATAVRDIGPVRWVAAGGGLRSDRAGRSHTARSGRRARCAAGAPTPTRSAAPRPPP